MVINLLIVLCVLLSAAKHTTINYFPALEGGDKGVGEKTLTIPLTPFLPGRGKTMMSKAVQKAAQLCSSAEKKMAQNIYAPITHPMEA